MTEMLDRAEIAGRVTFDDLEIGEIALEYDDQEPEEIIEWALSTFGDRIAIVTAMQADGMAILDMAARIRPDVRVITVDTGRLPQETYAFIDEVRKRYPETRWDIPFPDTSEVEAMTRRCGPNAPGCPCRKSSAGSALLSASGASSPPRRWRRSSRSSPRRRASPSTATRSPRAAARSGRSTTNPASGAGPWLGPPDQ